MEINENGNWKLYWGSAPLPQGAEAMGTVTRTPGDTGALIRMEGGSMVQGNAGAIRTLPPVRGGKRTGAGRPAGSTTGTAKKMRSMRLSDREYAAVQEFVKTMKGE